MVKGRQTVRLAQSQRKQDKVGNESSADSPPVEAPSDSNPLSANNFRRALGLAAPLLTLAALTSPVSQATLAPVYGAIPSSVNHAEAITATMLLGYLWRVTFRDMHSWSIMPYLALWCFWMPIIQGYLFKYSAQLGPVFGPVLTGFLSCHTVIIAASYAAAQALEVLDLQGALGHIAGMAIPAIALDLLFFRPVEKGLAGYLLPLLTTRSNVFKPVNIQLFIAATYTFMSPAKPYWLFTLTAPALLHAFLANPHFDSPWGTDALNRDLAKHDWTLVDRAWSNTGYISVLESLEHHYRVLRCDHSLLGGEWLLTEERRQNEGWHVNEPIYAVFEMLEAVRLVERHPAVPDADARALVVGLGIGTAPKALMAHGVATTIVELDPVVHRYAVQYFDLPSGHEPTVVLQDAVTWVGAQAEGTNTTSTATVVSRAPQYDYIIHDVFTGGAEPLALFTNTFLSDLRALLSPQGVIALNYAGDLGSPLTTLVLHTIQHVFAGQCKIYRDAPPAPSASTSSAKKESGAEDFLNLVVFCRNDPGQITFRRPVEADYLRSRSRRHYLLPRAEHEIAFPAVVEAGAGAGSESGERKKLLRVGDEVAWRAQQEESAVRHWQIMRRVMPAAVWELW